MALSKNTLQKSWKTTHQAEIIDTDRTKRDTRLKSEQIDKLNDAHTQSVHKIATQTHTSDATLRSTTQIHRAHILYCKTTDEE